MFSVLHFHLCFSDIYEGGPKKTPELSSAGQAPCSTGFPTALPQLGECSRNPSASVYQLVLLWEAVFSFSEFFFKNFNAFAHFMMGDSQAYLQHHAECSAIFDPKQHDPPAPPSLLTWPHLTLSNFFSFCFPRWEKCPQRETCYQCGRAETKNGRSTKQRQNRVQKLFQTVGKNNISIGVLHQMESALKVTEF